MSKKLKILIAILSIAILSVPIGIITMDKLAPKDKIYEGIYINETNVGNLSAKEATEKVTKQYNNELQNKNINAVYEDFSYIIDYKSLNARYDIDAAVKSAMDYGKGGNPFTRAITRFKIKNKPIKIELKFLADDSRIKEDVKAISKKIDKKAKNATISYTGSFNVTEGKDGLKVNEEKLEKELKKAINPEKKEEVVEIPVDVVKPKITASMLSEIDTKIQSFTTEFNPSNANRVGNIRVSSEAINGTVVLPGEVFSTNEAMGPRVKFLNK